MVFSKIGHGAFGHVYKGINIDTQEYVAIKIEAHDVKVSRLDHEHQIYNYIFEKSNNCSKLAIPKLYWYGIFNEHKLLIMERLGYSLEKVLSLLHNFSIKTIIMIAIETLNILEKIHSYDIIHRDIKPDNFVIGYKNNRNKIYLVDFGLSKKFSEYKTGKNLVGTMKYASINNHLGYEQSKRDDLESLSYMLIYLYHGTLPWKGIVAQDKNEKSQKICYIKQTVPITELCKDMPIEFQFFVKYSRKLKYDRTPDYKMLQNLFIALLERNNYSFDRKYDWIISCDVLKTKKSKKKKSSSRIIEI